VPASVARTGVQVYSDANGREVREYRPPEEVFAADSQASLAGIPVTIGHPGAVDSTNWRRHAVGHVSDAPPSRRPDGAAEWLEASVYVADGHALERVERGDLVEVSMGYTADVVPQKGIAPDGTPYDAVQRNIRFNHLALLQDGRARAGRGARLRLDSNGDEQMLKQDGAERRIKVDGIDCDFGSETHVQMLERRAEQAVARADAAEQKAKAVEAEVGALKAKLDAVPQAPNVDALVQDELAFRDLMRPALAKDYQFAGKSREQVRLDAVGADVAARVAKLPEGQREGYLLHAVEAKLAAADKPTHAPTGVVTKTDSAPAKFDPYAKLKAAHAASYNHGGAK
jgi:hypothetical protein